VGESGPLHQRRHRLSPPGPALTNQNFMVNSEYSFHHNFLFKSIEFSTRTGMRESLTTPALPRRGTCSRVGGFGPVIGYQRSLAAAQW
jgi:hypothetical protein